MILWTCFPKWGKMKWKLSTYHPPTFISVSLSVSSTTESFQLLNSVFRVGVMMSGADFLRGGFSPAVVVKIWCEVNLDELGCFWYFYLGESVLERILVFWDWHELSSPTWNSVSCVKDENRSWKIYYVSLYAVNMNIYNLFRIQEFRERNG